jgi:DNA polymerase-3 subunit chi
VSAATRVDFYLLSAAEPASRLHFACRLAEKAYKLKNNVYAHTTSEAEAGQLDELLWTFREGSFVPHGLLADQPDARTPVQIGTPEQATTQGELLINLSAAAPTFAANFARVAEIVDNSEASKQAARERFKQYREMGLEPTTHNID